MKQVLTFLTLMSIPFSSYSGWIPLKTTQSPPPQAQKRSPPSDGQRIEIRHHTTIEVKRSPDGKLIKTERAEIRKQ